MNSIKTNSGKRPNGQPAGTNKEKNLVRCALNPRIVAPTTIVKLNEKVTIKCDVDAKLYGTIPIRLLANINKNNENIKGKYICPFPLFI